MDSHAFLLLCANRAFGSVAFIQRNSSFLMENAEAYNEARLQSLLNDKFVPD